jgi:hypothetical protein
MAAKMQNILAEQGSTLMAVEAVVLFSTAE